MRTLFISENCFSRNRKKADNIDVELGDGTLGFFANGFYYYRYYSVSRQCFVYLRQKYNNK